MSIQSICRYLYILTFSALFVFCSAPVFAQDTVVVGDTIVADTTSRATMRKQDSAGHQLCVGIDLFHPVVNHFQGDRSAFEAEFDYYLHNEFYGAMELGWGGSTVNYVDLKYTTTNTFMRLGFNKTVLARDNPRDWDMMFFGLRLGIADVKRSAFSFMIIDSVWGNTRDSSIARKPPFLAVWLELTTGMRVAMTKDLFAGWNLRGKFMMNGKSFSDLAPLYIAGYGRGDKNTSFDFNVYISYAIRWKRNLHDKLRIEQLERKEISK